MYLLFISTSSLGKMSPQVLDLGLTGWVRVQYAGRARKGILDRRSQWRAQVQGRNRQRVSVSSQRYAKAVPHAQLAEREKMGPAREEKPDHEDWDCLTRLSGSSGGSGRGVERSWGGAPRKTMWNTGRPLKACPTVIRFHFSTGVSRWWEHCVPPKGLLHSFSLSAWNSLDCEPGHHY